MAVIQISKIQVRRGLQENLPQLASGEFGWSIDQQRLYIGNGTLSEGAPTTGNTELLTAKSNLSELITAYTFRGTQSGYTSQTGPTANEPVQRALVGKLDDIISLRDFITDDDIASNDYTAAIQRAIDEIYPILYFNNRATRRQIYIPGGDYPISGVITLPPYAKIRGDGPESTRIVQTNPAAEAIFKFKDSRRQTDTDLGLDAAELPRHNEISNVTLEQDTDNHIVIVDSAREMLFTNVKFRGVHVNPAVLGSSKAGVYIKSTAGELGRFVGESAGNTKFHDCYFVQNTIGILVEGKIYNVSVTESVFELEYIGVLARQSAGNSPESIKILNTRFHAIAQQAIVSEDQAAVTSVTNYFQSDVGQGDGVDVSSGVPTSAMIEFNTTNNYSFGDIFLRSAADQQVHPLVSYIAANAAPANENLISSYGVLQSEPGKLVVLGDDAVGNIVVLAGSLSSIVDYSIVRGSDSRTGTAIISHNNSQSVVDDNYIETNNIGITLDYTSAGNTVVVSYSASNTGQDATLKYSIRKFI